MTPRDRYLIRKMFEILMMSLFVLLRHSMELNTYKQIREEYDKFIDDTKDWIIGND